MGILQSLRMHCLLFFIFDLSTSLTAQPQPNTVLPIGQTSALDSLLQDYAFRALTHPKTGIPYDASVPSNLTGIKVSALRLRNGSLRKRGVKSYKEFEIPTGIAINPYVVRLVLVYQNLGNMSTAFYPLSGYRFLSPILGLLAYNASNLSAKNLPKLTLKPTYKPILIHFSDYNPPPSGTTPKCMSIGLNGSVNFSNVMAGNICSAMDQGHFSIVVESISPSPAPNVSPTSPKNDRNTKVWIVVGSVLSGLTLFSLLLLLTLCGKKFKQRKKMEKMEKAAESGEPLEMTSVGDTKAPAAMVTRTQPTLESEYVP